MPYHSDQRLIRVLPELKKLIVYTLEKHDVALSKMWRGYETDMAAIAMLHAQVGLDEELLVERYLGEMQQGIGNRERHDQSLVLLIRRLYGEIEADGVRERLAAQARPRIRGGKPRGGGS